MNAFEGKKFRLKTVCLFQRLIIGQFILDRLFACWLLRKLWASSFARSVKFLSLLSEWVGDWGSSAWDTEFAWIVKIALKCSQNVHFHDSFWREQTLAATKLFLSLTRIDFAVAVSSRAVRISSRAVRVLSAPSLRRVQPSYRTFSLMVFQGNYALGRTYTGHTINAVISSQQKHESVWSVIIVSRSVLNSSGIW